jgi:cytochrome c oxidase subunit 2
MDRRFNTTPLCLLLLPLILAGCSTAQSTYHTEGHAAHEIAKLSWFMTILFLLVTAVMWVLLSVAVNRRRGTLSEHAPIDSGGGQAWIAIGGLAIPLLVLSLIFVLGLRLLSRFPIHGAHGAMEMNHGAMNRGEVKSPDILVIGHQWWWEVHYLDGDLDQQFTTANEIHIPTNRPVDIELESADVMHSFWIPGLHGKVDLIPGHTNFVRLEASRVGSFPGQCAEYCGAQHAHMRLLVVAQPADEYAAWTQQQVKPAADPTTAIARAGEQTFVAGPCSLCHQVRGTNSGGRVGPDLTHVGSRQYLAANTIPNNDAYLEAWITHAQSFKPEAQMPDLTQFDGRQLQGLVAYLRQLQ